MDRANAGLKAKPVDARSIRGIRIAGSTTTDAGAAREQFGAWLARRALGDDSIVIESEGATLRLRLAEKAIDHLAPGLDTLGLAGRAGLDTYGNADDLDREIALAMLASPFGFDFPSVEEAIAAIEVRHRIVAAGRLTALAFKTFAAERPEDYWTYDEDRGFTVLPGKPLIEALRKATQPGADGRLYSFSCYRATEYVTLLAIAEVLQARNPALLVKLQRQWERAAIASGRFHDVFLREFGTLEDPVPQRYYVPGDRVWFRNPEENSADGAGFEGSWVFYHGDGRFTNFWRRDCCFTLDDKCLEIYHWRHGAYRDAAGEIRIDEAVVAKRVAETRANPLETTRILERMQRLRDPRGIYAEGGCIDATREAPRWLCPSTTDLQLPDA